MHQDPTTPPAQSPLGQAVAAIIAILVAMLAEHARANPGLAGLIALTIKRLEALPAKLDAMVAAHQSPESDSRRRAQFTAPPLRARRNLKHATHMETERQRKDPSLRLSVSMWNRLPSARAPPRPMA